MDRTIAKAINNISKKLNDICQRLNKYFNCRCDSNHSDIIASEQTITDMDLAMIESEQQMTDMDLRIMELEMGGE